VASSIETKPVGEKTAADETKKESFWTGGRVAITVIIVGLVVWYGVARHSSTNVAPTSGVNTPTSKAPSGNNPNNPAAPVAFVAVPAELREATLQTLDGKSLKLSDYADKVVVLNMWATWCGPCRMEMPELIKMSNEYKSRGLVVLGLTTSYNEQQGGQQGVKDYVKEHNVPYQIIWDDGTLAIPLVQAVQGRSVIPQSFVISRDGKIVKHFSGFNAYQTPQLMRQAIEDALGDKGKA
jgi:thiol-disulfide isomerase/thioredoxin